MLFTKKYTIICPKFNEFIMINYFHMYYSKYFKYSDSTSLCTKYNNPIVLINNPIDRFILLYLYWKNIKIINYKLKWNQYVYDADRLFLIKEFITELSTNQIIHSKPSNINENEWLSIFKQQSEWINLLDYKYIGIVACNNNNINKQINRLLTHLHITNKNIHIPNKIKYNLDSMKKLTNNEFLEVHQLFRNDLLLWNNIKYNKDIFKFVI